MLPPDGTMSRLEILMPLVYEQKWQHKAKESDFHTNKLDHSDNQRLETLVFSLENKNKNFLSQHVHLTHPNLKTKNISTFLLHVTLTFHKYSLFVCKHTIEDKTPGGLYNRLAAGRFEKKKKKKMEN